VKYIRRDAPDWDKHNSEGQRAFDFLRNVVFKGDEAALYKALKQLPCPLEGCRAKAGHPCGANDDLGSTHFVRATGLRKITETI
jgi:hypothetical protein